VPPHGVRMVRTVTFFVALAGPLGAVAGPKPSRAGAANARTGRAVPPVAELVKAARKNDRAALERLAGRFGVARLGEAAASPDAKVATAALATIPLARGGVLLSSLVAQRLVDADPGVVVAAARALGALLSGDSTTTLGEWEVPLDTIAASCGALGRLAARAESPLVARFAAIDALGLAQPICGGGDVARVARDPDPTVRRAAVLALRAGDPTAAPVLRDGLADSDARVATACAATLCRGVDPAGRAKADPQLARATVAARAFAAAPATPPEDAVEMLACVAAARTPADRALLEALHRSAAGAVRARAEELLSASGGPANGPASAKHE
jgi:hypothetical protein